MIRKIKTYYCAYCPNKEIDFGNICATCKGKKRKGVKLEKLYKEGSYWSRCNKSLDGRHSFEARYKKLTVNILEDNPLSEEPSTYKECKYCHIIEK